MRFLAHSSLAAREYRVKDSFYRIGMQTLSRINFLKS